MTNRLEDAYDIVIVGSGGGAIPAALVARSLGQSVVILEKESVIGGSTSYSGGVLWVPNNPLLAQAGVKDSFEQSRRYFDAAVTYKGPSVSPERRDAFLKAGPRMISFLNARGMKFRRPYIDWPDYYDDLPGGLAEGRALLAEPFDLRELGEHMADLALYGPLAHMPISSEEFTTLFLMKRTLKGKLKALKYAYLMARDKMLGRQTVANGAAIQGRMFQIALKEGIPIFRQVAVSDFIVENGRVVGVEATHEGKQLHVTAKRGVIVNAGGYARNQEFRKKHGRHPVSAEWSSAPPGDTGDMTQAMINLGAATDVLDTAWWVVTSQNVDGSWPEGAVWPDGRVFPFLHHLDLSLPFSMMVDQDGNRFCNEAGAYMEIGERMLDRQREIGRCVPAWTIFDSRHRERYPWGAQPPGKTPASWIESGYMRKAGTLAELAQSCGIDEAGLLAQVARFNDFCQNGRDEDFARGGKEFDRSHGDPTVAPNPSLGAIEQGPFYAVAMFPGDVGTAGGVVTDAFARVQRKDGVPIKGLYAIGNAAASVFGRSYPAAGASIGSALTFGFVAAHHASGSNELVDFLS